MVRRRWDGRAASARRQLECDSYLGRDARTRAKLGIVALHGGDVIGGGALGDRDRGASAANIVEVRALLNREPDGSVGQPLAAFHVELADDRAILGHEHNGSIGQLSAALQIEVG